LQRGFNVAAIAVIHKEPILEFLRSGKRIKDAIESLQLGVSTQAVHKALKDDPDYNDAIIEWHAARLDESERMLAAATDMVDVARAKSYAEAVRWRASREKREKWGDQPTHVAAGDLQVTINIGGVDAPSCRIGGTVIEHDAGDAAK
jgi:hypothetical protein